MPRWLQIVLHVAVIAAGAAGSVMTGSPVPLIASGAVNALIKSPFSANTKEEHIASAEKIAATEELKQQQNPQ